MAESRQGDIFRPGDLLNNTYRIDRVLGRGGTSEVYKARNEISGRFVAIKVLRSEFAGDEAFVTLMRREEEIREIRHDAVVRYSENHRTPEGLIYLVMDYVDGPGLDTLLKAGGLPADDLVQVCRRVADGLKLAHARRIIHRDLSPDNIILKGGKPEQAVIIDFGIAKDANPGAQTIVGNEFAGKYAYAAPEQLAGQTDARSDLYALGALLLATFRGKRPDAGANPMEVLRKKQMPLDTSGVPEPLKSLIDKLSNPDPAQRFQSAEAVLQAIDQALPADTAAQIEDRTVLRPIPQAVLKATIPAYPPADPAKPAKAPAVQGPAATVRPSTSKVGIAAAVMLLAAGLGLGAYVAGLFGKTEVPALPATTEASAPPSPATAATATVSTPTAPKPADPVQPNPTMPPPVTPSAGKPPVPEPPIPKPIAPELPAPGTGSLQSGAEQAAVDPPPPEPSSKTPAAQAPFFLTAEVLAPVLAQQADCGPLVLQDPPVTGYGKGQTITVLGRLARPEAQVALFDALKTMAPELKLDLKIELLNPALCQIETTLPKARAGGFAFAFGYGDSADDNPSGRYFVGENPVVDLVIPAAVTDGYVSVSIIDVSGNVFHLLPNVNRTENAVSALRGGIEGPFKVRIAYPLSDNKDASHIAFTVDATSLGKSKVVVIQSQTPLFAELRPTTESVGGFAAALKAAVDAGSLDVLSLDSRILTSIAR